ncbi:multidrug effflux MFS transporter [Aliiruegeria lutimaris]|uniref:MFS transporter, DHA1 family, bicyclomycin/chloramphenicol resistance protein n=1 Tax=Aliiruegeria lutimaris TaxID=571298 RepID=A0A1G8KR81_9RHOB|nr:multidrug effflux MFS transporter [Aliiruegeria lutimaris]SDI45886.1 MFS transporter, DHA1 family, bicyclomycin/chloramphenicol resistance protein [Aliiruegeria lutimaris]
MTAPEKPLGQVEFIALMAMLFAMVAFSIDAMLPALPEIAADISPDAPNRAQLIITSFVLGIGLGTLCTGPLSDAFGRKPVIVAGAGLYIIGAVLALMANSVETIFAARLIQGIGAAGPRVVAVAIIRDLYSGRQMARMMSFIMLVFTLVPAIAPTLGAGVIWLAGWHAVFIAFILFAMISTLWLSLRQPETLPRESRRPFRVDPLLEGVREILTHRVVALSLATQTLVFGSFFATISSTQQVFDQTFGRGENFHFWFGAIALCAAPASVINARLVERIGMRGMITRVLAVEICVTALAVGLNWLIPLGATALFFVYFIWTISMFFMVGLTGGNLNALSMEPMGHLAGLTASVTGSLGTIGAVALAIPLGLAFDGTPLPLMIGSLFLVTTAFGMMLLLRATDPQRHMAT